MARDPLLPGASRQHAVHAIDNGPDTPWGLLTTTADGTIVDVNARFALWSGRSREALLGDLRWKQLLAPASRILYETHFVPRLEAQGAVSEVSLDLALENGGRFPILASALRRLGEVGMKEMTTVSITVFDATETRRFEQVLRIARRDAEAATDALAVSHRALHVEHERLRVMLRSIADAVITSNAQGLVTSFNPTAEEVTGLSSAQALGAPLASIGLLLEARSRRPVDLVHLQHELSTSIAMDFLLVRSDGSERYLECTVAPLRDEAGHIEGCVFVWRDVTQKRADAAQRRFDITHDRLTQLFNRSEFERRIGLELAATRGVPVLPQLLLHIGLDQFKIINDTVGATVGDDFLVEIAALLRQNLQRPHTLARLGGDEFGVLLPHCAVAEGVALAEALRCRIEAFPLRHNQLSYTLTASVGLAVLPESGGSADGALAHASMACQAAKEAGRNRVHIVEAEDTHLRQRREQMGWMTRLSRDLGEDRFELYFQPIVRIDGTPQALRHGELLLRLRDDAGQLMPPGDFINAAERYHKMGQVDRWVLGQAFDWLDHQPGVQVSINVSGQSFGDAKFLTYVIERMAKRRWHPAQVCFEITETAAIADLPAALRFIACLRERGCLFSLDDFGAGLSSFGYLRSLPVDFVKIDGSFVKTMTADPINRGIVASIHSVARLCGLQTVAEWVEDAATLKALQEIGVDHAQGWGVGKPVPLRAIGTIDRDQVITKHSIEKFL
jgi:diguanylate cyclase (GGDEF)-like protein/PAS domain S-box-containing protein